MAAVVFVWKALTAATKAATAWWPLRKRRRRGAKRTSQRWCWETVRAIAEADVAAIAAAAVTEMRIGPLLLVEQQQVQLHPRRHPMQRHVQQRDHGRRPVANAQEKTCEPQELGSLQTLKLPPTQPLLQ